MGLLTLRAFLYSLAIHAVVIALLVVSFDSAQRPVIKPRENIIEAVTVENKEVEKELQRLKDLESQRQRKKEQALRELEKKAEAAEQKRKKEQQRLAGLKKKEAQEKKLAAEKKRREEEKKRAEAERREERRKAEAERKRMEEEKKKAAARALKEQLEKEQQELAVAQRREDENLRQTIIASTSRKVAGNFNKTGLPKGLECILSVQTIPGGEVISVALDKSSGNDIFDRRAVVAVEKASPLPLPVDAARFDRLGLRKFRFRFKPTD